MMIREKNDFENFTQKLHDSSRKKTSKFGQFYVTLICSINLREKTHGTSRENINNICHLRHVWAHFPVRFSLFSIL